MAEQTCRTCVAAGRDLAEFRSFCFQLLSTSIDLWTMMAVELVAHSFVRIYCREHPVDFGQVPKNSTLSVGFRRFFPRSVRDEMAAAFNLHNAIQTLCTAHNVHSCLSSPSSDSVSIVVISSSCRFADSPNH